MTAQTGTWVGASSAIGTPPGVQSAAHLTNNGGAAIDVSNGQTVTRVQPGTSATVVLPAGNQLTGSAVIPPSTGGVFSQRNPNPPAPPSVSLVWTIGVLS
jgi:hypothetical protein